jgi:hypothetical protein
MINIEVIYFAKDSVEELRPKAPPYLYPKLLGKDGN